MAAASEFIDIDEGKLDLILQDSALRDELGIGAGTGPKGVKADYKFHMKQERLRETEKTNAYHDKLSNSALRSGWIDREIAREDREKNPADQDESRYAQEESDDEADDLIRELEDEIADNCNIETLLEKTNQLNLRHLIYQRTRYGSLLRATAETFVPLIDSTDPDVSLFIHISNPRLAGCRIMDSLLGCIAQKYPASRFVVVDRDEIKASFDDSVMPVIVCYRAGELVESLIGFVHELGKWRQEGTCEPEDLEEMFLKLSLLNENDIVDAAY